MLDFKCDKNQKEEIKSVLFTELSKMYLQSMSYLFGSEAAYNSDDLALIEQGKDILYRTIKVKDKKGGFSIDTSTTDDICFVLAGEIRNENSYSEGKECSIESALQHVLDRFAGVSVKGEFEAQGNGYYCVYEILTRDGKVVKVDESGEESSARNDGEKKYDEKRFIKDAEAAFPYKKFMEMFKINSEFKPKDYKDFFAWKCSSSKNALLQGRKDLQRIQNVYISMCF